jgi:glyceraldehyde 3-phosphate dehydrogenase
VHAYTGTQAIVDGPSKDLREARAAALNIIPSSTGAARATSLVLEAMKGRLDGQSLRVPVADGSITDFTAVLDRDVTVDEVNDAFRAASESGPLAKVLVYNDKPIVSSDIVGSSASCTFDSPLTMAMGSLVKVLGWYDNEWGYSNRLVDLIQIVGAKLT